MSVTVTLAFLAMAALITVILVVNRRLPARRREQILGTGVGIAVFDAKDYVVRDNILICTCTDETQVQIPGSAIIAWAATGQGSGGEEYELLLRDRPTTFLQDHDDNKLYDALIAIAGDKDKSTE